MGPAPAVSFGCVLVIYTDGACSGNPGPGGWAWAIDHERYASGSEAQSTNQRMEVRAVAEAIADNPGPLEIRSDSTYVVHCFRDRWWAGWERRGWRNSQRREVANQDLWRPLVAAYRERSDEITFSWVKGHSGDPMNDRVDALAVVAARSVAPGAGRAPSEPVVPSERLF